jgi:hypothetical protein
VGSVAVPDKQPAATKTKINVKVVKNLSENLVFIKFEDFAKNKSFYPNHTQIGFYKANMS